MAGAVRTTHLNEGITGGGHDLEHAARVGQYALLISENPYEGRLAGVAGLCHNADRILQRRLQIGKHKVPENEVKKLVHFWLKRTDIDGIAKSLVFEAVHLDIGIPTQRVGASALPIRASFEIVNSYSIYKG